MKRGYTLVELLIVLAIIALVSAMVVPRMAGQLSNVNLKTAARKTVASLRYARNMAVSEKVVCTVVFNLDRGYVSLVRMEDQEVHDKEKKKVISRYLLPSDVRLEKFVFPGGEEVKTGGVQEVMFFPNGSSSGGKVVLRNARDHRFCITIDFITGMVTLESCTE